MSRLPNSISHIRLSLISVEPFTYHTNLAHNKRALSSSFLLLLCIQPGPKTGLVFAQSIGTGVEGGVHGGGGMVQVRARNTGTLVIAHNYR